MSFTITIEEHRTVVSKKRQWLPVGVGKGQDRGDGSNTRYDHADVEHIVTEDVKQTVYQQTVGNIDVLSVILAVNEGVPETEPEF